MPSVTVGSLVLARWIAIGVAAAVSAIAVGLLTSDTLPVAWSLWPYALFLVAGLVSSHFRAQALATGVAMVVSALSIVIYVDTTRSSDAQLPLGLAAFPLVQAVVGVVLIGILVIFRLTVARRASNSDRQRHRPLCATRAAWCASSRTLGMPIRARAEVNALALRILSIVLACVGALLLYQVVLAQYAMARFGERWMVEYPIVGTYGPLFAIALASGAFVGLVVGILARAKALEIAAWAGLCACVVTFFAAAAAGGIAWAITNIVLITAPLIAGGLVMGALAGRRLGHA